MIEIIAMLVLYHRRMTDGGRVTDLEGVPRSTRRVEPREGKVRQDPLVI